MDLTEKSSAEPWNLPRRLAFRFAFAYWLLLCLPFPLDVIPGFEIVSELYRAGENRFVPWVAAHILHLPEPIEAARNGSGDTTFRWVQLLCVFSLAVIVATLWSLLDRKRRAYPWLDDSLRVYVRFFLLSLLWVYGMDKVIQVQFPVPGPSRMLQTYGESSPMGLLWTFMGSSTAYTAFSGAMEVLGGFLLFFRRTTSLGALVAAGVMTNVVALNFCYDVPVKILSSHLLLAAIYLLAPDLGRLFKVLVSNRSTAVRNLAPPPLRWRWLRIARALVWLAFCVSTATFAIRGSLNAHREAQKKPAIYGTYQVAEFIRNGETPPPLLTDQALWRLVTFENGGLVIIRALDRSRSYFGVVTNPIQRTMTFYDSSPEEKAYEFRFERTAKRGIVLEGKWLAGESLRVTLEPLPSKFPLLSRGFHWINEYPNSH